ncbi:hypothetical protein Tco_0411030 [Tanacetum coccineum]
MSTPKFAETHNLVAFLEKPEESNRFEEIINFLNASSVQYALTVNPTIYTTCIEQFWTFAKVKTVNGEQQIQALVDKKKVIISETSIRSDLKLDDAEGTYCLPTSTIFAELERMGKVFCYMEETIFKVFSGRVNHYSLQWRFNLQKTFVCIFTTPTDSHSTPIITQPSSSKPQKKKSRRKQRKDNAPTKPTTEETTTEEHVSTPSFDPPPSGEDRMQLAELMSLYTNLQEKVLDLEKTKTAQAKEITSLKKRVKQLEKRRKSRTSGLRRLRKVGSSTRVKSSNDASLGAQEDASKQGRKIKDLDADAEVTLVNVTQEINDDNPMFDIDEFVLLAQTLIKIKNAKPNPVTTAATTVTSIRSRAKGIIFHDQEEQVPASTKTFSSSQSQLPQLQAELIEEERLARQKEEEANIALIESWDNTQAMMEEDFELAQRLQAEEQGEITIEERSRLFVELMNRRKKHFAKLRAEEIRRKPPTKAQKRNQMSTYLKNMVGFKHSQLKSKSYDEIQNLFDKEIKRVNTFVDMNSEVVKGSETRTEESSKREGDELKFDKSKKQKIDEHVEAEKDDDLEEEEMKKHMEIVQDEEFKDSSLLIRADEGSKRYSSMIRMLMDKEKEKGLDGSRKLMTKAGNGSMKCLNASSWDQHRIKIPVLNQSTTKYYEEEEEKIDDEETMDEEEYNEVTKELYDDVNVKLGNEDTTDMTNADQDAHVTLTPVLNTQKADEPAQSSSISSDFTSKLLNLENPSPADNEITSLMDTTTRHATTVSEITSSFTTTIPPLPPFFNPLIQQATPTPTPTTSKATTSFPSLQDFSFVFKFNDKVTNLEKDLSEIKQFDQYAQALSSIPAIVDLLDFATPVIEKNVTESLEAAVLTRQDRGNDYKKKLYDALVESYNTDKDLFNTYGKVFTLKRSRDDSDKDRDPFAGSNQGTKRRKSSKEAKSSKDSRSKENKSSSTSKDVSQSQHKKRIIVVTRLLIMNKYDYGHLEETEVRREDQKLYKFREGDFLRLLLQDIEDMLLILVQKKLTNLTIDERYDLNVALRMFTRGNCHSQGPGGRSFNRGIRLNICQREIGWRRQTKSQVNNSDIDKQLKRRLMRNLEKFIGGREYGNDLWLLEWTI